MNFPSYVSVKFHVCGPAIPTTIHHSLVITTGMVQRAPITLAEGPWAGNHIKLLHLTGKRKLYEGYTAPVSGSSRSYLRLYCMCSRVSNAELLSLYFPPWKGPILVQLGSHRQSVNQQDHGIWVDRFTGSKSGRRFCNLFDLLIISA